MFLLSVFAVGIGVGIDNHRAGSGRHTGLSLQFKLFTRDSLLVTSYSITLFTFLNLPLLF